MVRWASIALSEGSRCLVCFRSWGKLCEELPFSCVAWRVMVSRKAWQRVVPLMTVVLLKKRWPWSLASARMVLAMLPVGRVLGSGNHAVCFKRTHPNKYRHSA
jgi:hypothetical protein